MRDRTVRRQATTQAERPARMPTVIAFARDHGEGSLTVDHLQRAPREYTVRDLLSEQELEDLAQGRDLPALVEPDDDDWPEGDLIPSTERALSQVPGQGPLSRGARLGHAAGAIAVVFFTIVLALAPSGEPGDTVSAVSAVVVGLAVLYLSGSRHERRRVGGRSARPALPTGADDTLYGEALQFCLKGEYHSAEAYWSALADRDHLPSRFALACLRAIADPMDQRAYKDLSRLRLLHPELRVRAGLGLALLEMRTAPGCNSVLRSMRAVAELRPLALSPAEERAAKRASHLARIVELHKDKDREAIEEMAGLPTKRRLVQQFVHALTILDRRTAGSRWQAAKRQRELTLAVGHLLATALPFEASDGSVYGIVPADLAPERPEPPSRRIVMAVPVLGSDHPESDPYAYEWITRFSRWSIAHGIRGISLSVASCVASVAAAVAIGLRSFAWAAVLLILSALLDTVDGRVAQLSSKDVRVGLFLDYVFDRLADVALAAGLLAMVLRHSVAIGESSSVVALIGVFAFVLTTLLASYIRAEADRLDLDGAGGGFERPHRMIFLIVGLVAQQPIVIIYAVAVLSTITVIARLRNAVQAAEAQSVVNLGLRSTTIPIPSVSQSNVGGGP